MCYGNLNEPNYPAEKAERLAHKESFEDKNLQDDESNLLEPPVGMPEPNPSFGQWVEAEYKLPDDGEEVIFINPGKHIRIGEYSDDEFMQGYWVNKCEQYLTKDIKRWMPLPKL